jgi:hypothetical protein
VKRGNQLSPYGGASERDEAIVRRTDGRGGGQRLAPARAAGTNGDAFKNRCRFERLGMPRAGPCGEPMANTTPFQRWYSCMRQ